MRYTATGRGWWLVVIGLGVLTAGGIVGLLGAQPGYVAAAVGFVLSTALGAPPLALASRLGRGVWGVPARRLAEVFACGSLIVLPVAIGLEGRLPDWHLRPGVWLDWPAAPQVWDAFALGVLVLASLGVLVVPSLPEGRWWGSPKQWRVVQLGSVATASLYLMSFVFVQVLASSDLAMSLVPGWQSPNFAAFSAVAGLEGGVATTVLALAVARLVWPALREPIGADTFSACGRILLALALLWFYFTWAELLTYWYGRTPAELGLLGLLMGGPSLPLFVAGAGLSCVLPVLLLIWNRLRNSIGGVSLVAGSIVLGTLFDRLRTFVAAWAVVGPVRDRLGTFPQALPMPAPADVLVLIGLPAAVVLLVVLLLRRLPAVSTWEMREAALLRQERPFGRTRVAVIGKPS